MFLAFLSARVRQWLLFALVLPFAGKLLSALGVRLQGRSPRAGSFLQQAGGFASTPRGRRARRRSRR